MIAWLKESYLWAAICAFLAASGPAFAVHEQGFSWWLDIGGSVIFAHYAHVTYHRAERATERRRIERMKVPS